MSEARRKPRVEAFEAASDDDDAEPCAIVLDPEKHDAAFVPRPSDGHWAAVSQYGDEFLEQDMKWLRQQFGSSDEG